MSKLDLYIMLLCAFRIRVRGKQFCSDELSSLTAVSYRYYIDVVINVNGMQTSGNNKLRNAYFPFGFVYMHDERSISGYNKTGI